MIGLSTIGSISLGWALVAGRKRVPRPAAGNTALRTFIGMGCSVLGVRLLALGLSRTDHCNWSGLWVAIVVVASVLCLRDSLKFCHFHRHFHAGFPMPPLRG